MTNNLSLHSAPLAGLCQLEALAAPFLDPIFWRAERVWTPSPWWGHVPFGHWVVCALQPRVLVELGNPVGVSYSAFCHAVMRARLNTRCYAIWMAASGTEAETAFRIFHDEHYSAFSRPVSAEGGDAFFSDGTVDLLHIDLSADHTAVRRTVDYWLPKLSRAAVLLVHNINPSDGDESIRRLWEELSARFLNFEFPHGEGLGLLAVGANVPPTVAELCSMSDPAGILRIRDRFAAIGDRWEHAGREEFMSRTFAHEVSALSEQTNQLRREAALWKARFREEARARGQVAHRLSTARRDVYAANLRVGRAEIEADIARQREAAVLQSTAWRVTGPFRRLAAQHPRMARLCRRALRLIWRTVTFQLLSHNWEARYSRTTTDAPQSAAAPVPNIALVAPQEQPPEPVVLESADPVMPESDTDAEQIAAAHADLMDFLASDQRLLFETRGGPEVSIIVALPDHGPTILRCLSALRQQQGPRFEVIALNGASGPESSELLSRVDGIRVVAVSRHEHLLRACAQAAAMAGGTALLFLDGAACPRPGAVAAAFRALGSADDIGAVGGRIILSSGRLYEAGGMIWSDASLEFFGNGQREEASDTKFRREVDFVDTFLLTTRMAWRHLGGFDAGFPAPRYSRADYCMRLRDLGLRIMYEPGIAADTDVSFDWTEVPDSLAALHRSQVTFRSRHGEALRLHHLPAASANRLVGREYRRPGRRRLLVIDNEVPFSSLGAGYPRARAMLTVAAAGGWSVTFYPLRREDFQWEAAWKEIPADIEIAVRGGTAGLSEFLQERKGYYDAVLVSRPDNMEFVHATVRQYPDTLGGARLIYDAEAVFAHREVARAALEGHPYSAEQEEELCAAEAHQALGVDAITCVSDSEAEFFRSRSKAPVYVINHPVTPVVTTPPFAARSGFLFIGRLLKHTAPNWQGLSWFICQCWPRVRATLPDATLTVVGHLNPHHTDLQAPGVLLAGPAAELQPYYDAARVFIAPVRFAAGVPIKVLEATAGGVPTAATRLMARQLSWQPGVEIVAEDDAQALAVACIALHEDAEAWDAMRSAATARLSREFSAEQFGDAVQAALAGGPPPTRPTGRS